MESATKRIIDFFGVPTSDKIKDTEKFKTLVKDAELTPIGYFTNYETNKDNENRPILWVVSNDSLNGFVLENGQLHHWIVRTLHEI